MSRPFFEFAHPEDRHRSHETLERLAQGEEIMRFENRYIRKDGSVCWLEWSVRPVPAERRLYAAARDVTARHEAEERTRRTNAELAASRARVVAAADAERRRIERDLHDGTQQRLVALALSLRVAEAQAAARDPELRAQIAGVAEGLTAALAELQELSRGIHPTILSRGGLTPTLRALARRSAIPVELDATVSGRLEERVEVAVYYLVSEALTNAAKHAQATLVHVRIRQQPATLEVTVSDDGIGGADPSRGSGLLGLRDRVQTIGGTLELVSDPQHGTTITATLPLAASPPPDPEPAREASTGVMP
jgi:signal transduction histidine kinase